MTSLPDRTRPRLTQPARRIASTALRLASSAAWRTLHPSSREAFLEAPRPSTLPRLPYDAGDGWRGHLLRVPVRPGASGEPVILLHTAGRRADALVYGRSSLASSLAAAGYQVFLVAHRGDEGLSGPVAPTLEGVVAHDLPAALEVVRAECGARAVHVVGFGLGALFGLDLAVRCPHEVASVAALAPPLVFPDVRSQARAAQLVAQLLPRSWAVPLRALSRLGVPLVDATEHQPGPRRRGALAYTADDVPLAFALRMLDWVAGGAVEVVPHVDLLDAVGAARAPLLVLTGEQDTVALPEGASRLARAWGGPSVRRQVEGYGHTDLLLGSDVEPKVHGPLLAWLEALRSRAWDRVEHVA